MARKKKTLPTRKNGQYEVKQVVGTDIYGNPIRKSFYSSVSKEKAEEKARQYIVEKEVANQTGMGFLSKNTTFSEWANIWLETYKKPDVDERTYIDTYRNIIVNHLIPYFGNFILSDIKPINVKMFYGVKKRMSKSMLSKMRLCLNGIFNTAVDNDLCYKNPSRGIIPVSQKEKAVKKVYSDEEIHIVCEIAKFRMPEVIILLETGLRRGELLGLTWNDIDFKNKILDVNKSVADKKGGGVTINRPKCQSYRKIPLSDKAIATLRRLKQEDEYIFPAKTGGPYSPRRWSEKLGKFMASLPEDIQRLSPHELRHTYGTRLRREGVDIYTIQKIMGHKDINVTSGIYVHNEIDALRNALNNKSII